MRRHQKSNCRILCRCHYVVINMKSWEEIFPHIFLVPTVVKFWISKTQCSSRLIGITKIPLTAGATAASAAVVLHCTLQLLMIYCCTCLAAGVPWMLTARDATLARFHKLFQQNQRSHPYCCTLNGSSGSTFDGRCPSTLASSSSSSLCGCHPSHHISHYQPLLQVADVVLLQREIFEIFTRRDFTNPLRM